MTTDKEKSIRRLQKNLGAIRKIIGWTAQELADMLDITKQTMSNLETGRTKMSFVQYLAIRSLIDAEAQTGRLKDILPGIIENLLNNDELDEEEEDVVVKVMRQTASVITKETTDTELADANEYFSTKAGIDKIMASFAQVQERKKEIEKNHQEIDKTNQAIKGMKKSKAEKMLEPKNLAQVGVAGVLLGPIGLGAWLGKNILFDDKNDK